MSSKRTNDARLESLTRRGLVRAGAADVAAANLATLPLLALFLFFEKQLVEGIAMSGLKA